MSVRSNWLKKLKKPLIFGVVFFVALTGVVGSLNMIAPQPVVAQDRKNFDGWEDLRYYYRVDGRTLTIRGAVGDPEEVLFEWTSLDQGKNFGGTWIHPDGVCRRNGSDVCTVVHMDGIPNIFVGQRARDGVMSRGNAATGGLGTSGDPIPIDIGHPAYVAAYNRCMGTTGNAADLMDCVQEDPAVVDQTEQEAQDAANQDEEDPPSCESEGGDMSWILCPILGMFDSGLEWLDREINDLLNVPESYLSEDMEATWARLRNIAYIIIVPIMLVMIISTALNFEFVSAYTLKRAMPRMLAAVIFIALSWEIATFMVEIFNVIGRGTLGLMTSSFDGAATVSLSSLMAPDGTDSATAGSVGLLAIAAGAGAFLVGSITIGMLVSYAFVAFMFMFIAFLVLTFRQMLIIFLVVLAPLAILAWIFPGNDKLWKLWWGTFSKLLMMFPLIAGLIGVGRIFALTVNDTSADGVGTLIKLVAYVGPYFFIPATFKFAGGIFATVAGMANDKNRGLFDRQRKFREGSREKTKAQAKVGNRFKNGPAGLNTFAGGLSNIDKAGLRPRQWGTNMRTVMGDIGSMQAMEAAEKNADFQMIKGDDNLMKYAAKSKNAGELRKMLKDNNYGTDDQINQAVARTERFRKTVSADTFKQASTVAAVAGGTAYKDSGEMAEALAEAGGGDAAKTASLVAQARSAAMRAGRVDQGGAGFGKTLGAVQKLQEAAATKGGITDADRAAATETITGGALDSQSAMDLVGSRTKVEAVRNAVPILQKRLKVAKAESPEAYDRELARVAGLYDAMNQSSAQNAREMAVGGVDGEGIKHKGLMSEAIDGSGVTLQQELEARRDNKAFRELRREYGRSGTAHAEEELNRPSAPPEER